MWYKRENVAEDVWLLRPTLVSSAFTIWGPWIFSTCRTITKKIIMDCIKCITPLTRLPFSLIQCLSCPVGGYTLSWRPTKATGRCTVEQTQSSSSHLFLPRQALALHSSFTLGGTVYVRDSRCEGRLENTRKVKMSGGGWETRRKNLPDARLQVLCKQVLFQTAKVELQQQLCTSSVNSLCFSSESASHEAQVMDSLVAGTGGWRILQGHPLLREAIIS